MPVPTAVGFEGLSNVDLFFVEQLPNSMIAGKKKLNYKLDWTKNKDKIRYKKGNVRSFIKNAVTNECLYYAEGKNLLFMNKKKIFEINHSQN